jgi:hypothetical protein
LDNISPEYAGEGMFGISEPFELVPGEEYELWMKTDTMDSYAIYTCVAERVYDADTLLGVAIGNTAVIGGTIEADVPFVLIAVDASNEMAQYMSGMYMSLDGATTLNIRYLQGPVAIVRPVPEKYLPNTPLIVQFTSTVNADEMTWDVTTDTSFDEVLTALKNRKRPVIGYISQEGGTVTDVCHLATFTEDDIRFLYLSYDGSGDLLAGEVYWTSYGSVEFKRSRFKAVSVTD